MAITVAQLRTFVTVVRRGSVKRAAQELVVTQPSVSAAVAALSREVGERLVERDGRGLRPSPAGAAFVPYAEQVLGLLEQGRAAAREAADPDRRQLRLAAVTTAGEYLVPPLLSAFRQHHPEVEVFLEVGNRAGVLAQVGARTADIGIGGRPPLEGGILGTPFLDNELVLIAAAEDRLTRRRSVTFEELAGATWLLREPGSGTRTMVEEILAEHEVAPRVLTLGSNGAIKQSARVGLGVSIQSRHAVSLELATGMLGEVTVRGGLPGRKWFALYPEEGPRRTAAAEFLEFLQGRAAQAAVTGALSPSTN